MSIVASIPMNPNPAAYEQDIRSFLEIPEQFDLTDMVVIRCWRGLPDDAPQLAELAQRFKLKDRDGELLSDKLEIGGQAMYKLLDLGALGLILPSPPGETSSLPQAAALYCLGNICERLEGSEQINILHRAAFDARFPEDHLKALCRLPADLCVEDANGHNALQIACTLGNMAFVKTVMEELGTDWMDASQQTILHYACVPSAQRTFPAVLELVADSSAILNQESSKGETALGLVLQRRSLTKAMQLMDVGAKGLGSLNLIGLAFDLPRLLDTGDEEQGTEFINNLPDLLAEHPDKQAFLDTLLLEIARYARIGASSDHEAKKELRTYLTLLTEVVLAYGANPQAKDTEGKTARALWSDCRSGSKDAKRLLKKAVFSE